MHLGEYFSGSYVFRDSRPSFQKAFAVCAMFYLEIDPIYPHGDDPRKTAGLVKRINNFFDEEKDPVIFNSF